MKLSKNIGAVLISKIGNLPIASSGTTHNGTGVDRMPANSQQQYLSGVLVCNIGAETGSPSALTANFKIQDSADNSAWADTGFAIAAQTAGSVVVEYDFDASALDRYIRVVCVTTLTGGSSPTLPISSNLILGGSMLESVT